MHREKVVKQTPIAAQSIPAIIGKTNYPEPYASLVQGRLKHKLGDFFGLTNFGVNLTHLLPGAISALAHSHSTQDEFIFVLTGTPTLILGDQEFLLNPGECYGFKAGTGIAHHLVNRSAETVTYLEIGDRTAGDQVKYPNANLKATFINGEWMITDKDDRPYEQ
jgi:uncharacterized cupin superfamily protein